MPPRDLAFGIARLALAAPQRARRVDGARHRNADFAGQRRAAIAGATHSPVRVVDIGRRNERERRVAFEREARPVGRIGTARAAGLAQRLGGGARWNRMAFSRNAILL